MKILIIVAHPDDEVLGMGGTIKKLSKAGNKIKVIFLSTGILARRPTNGQQKLKALRKDAERATKVLGVNQVDFLDFPDNEMDLVSNLKLTKVIEKEITSFKLPKKPSSFLLLFKYPASNAKFPTFEVIPAFSPFSLYVEFGFSHSKV